MNRRLIAIILVALVLAAAIGGGYYYYHYRQSLAHPAGFALSNGRIEATEIDISTKAAGRVAEILVKEGDLIEPGQIVARMDTTEAEAALREAEAQAHQAAQTRDEASHVIEQRRGELVLVEQDLHRSEVLFGKGYATGQKVDQMHSSRVSTQAGVAAAQSSLAASDWAIRAAQAEVDRLRHQMSDGTLTAPRAGRVLFRLAEPGEVLGAGGKVLTLLDLSDIYMTVFLPAGIAGGLAIGTEARLILEPIPDRAIPATVTFISSRAQFTPKQVETQSERDRMMFRIKVSIPTALVERFVTQVKTGVTGIAYIRIDPATPWPDWLQSDLTRTAGP